MDTTMAIIDDIRALDDTAWDGLWPLLVAESHRRQVLASAREEAERLAADYLTARDGEQTQTPEADGAARWPAWVQPTGAHDAYPSGYQVTHDGRVWRSTTVANVWEPGAAGVPAGLWVDVTDAPEPTEPDVDAPAPAPGPGDAVDGGPEPYTSPASAAHPWEADVPYYTGDLVAWQGVTWRVIQDHSSQADWKPHLAHSLYTRA